MSKALLLAAGEGKRLRPLTLATPKCLLDVGGKPLLQYWLSLCAEHNIVEALINLHHHASQVQNFVESQEWPVQIRLFHEAKLLGSAGTLRANRDFFADEECFAILYADNLTNADLSAMRSAHLSRDTLLTMGLFEAEDPVACGIAEMGSDGRIVDFVEKPAQPKSNLANAGIYWASPKILDLIPGKTPCDIGFDLLPCLIGRMHGYVIREYLRDIGTRESYASAQKDVAAWSLMGKW